MLIIKKYHLIPVFAIFFALTVSMVIVSIPAVATKPKETNDEKGDVVEISGQELPEAPPETFEIPVDFEVPEGDPQEILEAILNGDLQALPEEEPKASGNGNSLPYWLAQPGDIIFTRGWIGNILPGYWTHCMMYYSNGWCIEANVWGVRWIRASSVRGADAAAIYRVNVRGSTRSAARYWCYYRLGLPYDFRWIYNPLGTKQIYDWRYYCSELCWAAYAAYGVNIDRNPGWTWKYRNNVAPQEIVDHCLTYRIAASW